MKIVQIGSFPLDAAFIKGGVEASVYGLALEQAKKNQVIIIDIPRTNLIEDMTEKTENVTVFRFSAHGGNNYSSIKRLKIVLATIVSQQPDICHIHTSSLFSFFLYLILKLKHIPVIVTVHGLAHIEKQNLWLKNRTPRNLIKYLTQSLTEFLFLSICPNIIVDTRYVKDAIKKYRKQWKIMRMPICHVIPQGVNPVFFQLKSVPVRNKLLAVGSISKRKGHLFLIDAMVKVKNQFPDFSLAIVGGMSDELYFHLLQKNIAEKKMDHYIQIYPNASFEEILKFYKSTELFVLHSEEESQGIVFCEAMACGKAIVATNVGGVPWVVENKVNGLLSDYGDIDTFADNVIRLLKDDSLRKKREENNMVQSRKYSWKYIADEVMKVYKSLI